MVVAKSFANLKGEILNEDICPVHGGKKAFQSSNSCHQCRQKSMKLSAVCKNMKGKRKCTMRMCSKCLLNRYGEKVEDVLLISDWKCPKCREICNCSVCMKKKVNVPTGQLFNVAKENGFLSVLEMLQKAASKKENGTANVEVFLPLRFVAYDKSTAQKPPVKKCSKKKREELKEISNSNENGISNICQSSKKSRKCFDTHNLGNKSKLEAFFQKKDTVCSHDSKAVGESGNPKSTKVASRKGSTNAHEAGEIRAQATLPSGEHARAIVGISISPEDVGEALQFLEFCEAFGSAFNLRKGQPEAMVTEIINGRQETRLRSSLSNSLVTQFHIRLLDMIANHLPQKPKFQDLKSSWIQAVGEIVSECHLMAGDFSNFDFKRIKSYEKLKISRKFKLLNFLCDAALNCNDLRTLIKSKVHNDPNKLKQKKSLNLNKKAYAQLVRTEPVLSLSDGRVLWRFNCKHGLSDNLLQHVKPESKEDWISYSDEQNMEVEKIITKYRTKRKRSYSGLVSTCY